MLFLKTISTQVQAIWSKISHKDIATGGTGNGTKVLYDDMTWGEITTPNSLNIISGTTSVTFLFEDNTAFVTINNLDLTNTNFVSFSYIPIESSNTSLDDFSLNGVLFSLESITNNTSFQLRATAANSATGEYSINYTILHT